MKSDEFIREVDEELRRDRMAALWRRYAPWIIGAALAVVLGTAAGVGWRAWQDHAREENARRFAAAERLLAGGQTAEAAAAFAELAEGGGGYAVLARLREAEALARAGDDEAAAATLARLAGDGSVESPYRELGGVLAALRALDGADPAQLGARLEGYADAGDPWRYTAREIHALSLLQAGDVEAARGALGELVNEPGTPAGLRRRAFELLASLGGPPGQQQNQEGEGQPESASPEQRPPPEEASQ